jgi:hypothetical protein
MSTEPTVVEKTDKAEGEIRPRPEVALAAPLPPPGPPARAKSPAVALCLALLFPGLGLGHVYIGQMAKALTIFAVFVSAIYLTAEGSALPFAFLIPFTILYAVVDAYASAMQLASGPQRPEEPVAESPAWGATLVGLGLLLLLNNLGWLRLADFHRYWPVLLIVAGGLFLRASLQKRRAPEASLETDSRD